MTTIKRQPTETERNIGQEILDAVREIQAGDGTHFQVKALPVVEARQKTGLSQAEFAQMLGVSLRTL